MTAASSDTPQGLPFLHGLGLDHLRPERFSNPSRQIRSSGQCKAIRPSAPPLADALRLLQVDRLLSFAAVLLPDEPPSVGSAEGIASAGQSPSFLSAWLLAR